ncbi:hypothetical protein H312_01117 [Anncaliia algerae PRA339]|uniref:Uncharacterized protein n=1 Tax=Anncaliia algerae PRA339 TaxID=1288291 RepID=A0A059F2M6_9MICR|nr:hypothetical protein H312_01117 [Anncaliia algerae PRA339]
MDCNKKEIPIEDEKLSYGEIIYVADQETTDLVSQAYEGDNKKQENDTLDQNNNPLIDKYLDNVNSKERIDAKGLKKSDAKNKSKREGVKNIEDKDNGVCLFNIVGVIVLVLLNV